MPVKLNIKNVNYVNYTKSRYHSVFDIFINSRLVCTLGNKSIRYFENKYYLRGKGI